MKFRRYAVYFTPENSSFADAGSTWLGWDITSAVRHESPAPDLTKRPRKYGFHATIKPPFSLAKGQDEGRLRDALADLCAAAKPVALEGLRLNRIGSFFAFTAIGETRQLAALASRVVRDLDQFRAPPSEQELARRRNAPLSPQEEENLKQWGYPYVMDSFRFHMTLTGPVGRYEGDPVRRQLQAHFADCDLTPFSINTLTLVGEDEEKLFHQIHRFHLNQ
ncbi:MAG: DUF1045 domain-containing protein [Roseobacter sp.]